MLGNLYYWLKILSLGCRKRNSDGGDKRASMVMVKVSIDIMPKSKSNSRERTYMLSRLQTSKVSTNRLPWTNKTNELCISASNVQMAKVSTECPRIAQVQAQKNQYGRFGSEVLIGISPLGVKTLNCKNKDKPTRMSH